jgi:hypothetical protein
VVGAALEVRLEYQIAAQGVDPQHAAVRQAREPQVVIAYQRAAIPLRLDPVGIGVHDRPARALLRPGVRHRQEFVLIETALEAVHGGIARS